MLIGTETSYAHPAMKPHLGNPVVPLLGARIRRAIGGLSADEIDRLGGDGALARVTSGARLSPLAINTSAVHWRAGAADCNGQPGLKIDAVMDYAGDRGLFTSMPWGTSETTVTIEITDDVVILTACGAVDDPEELVGAVRETISQIERIVTIQQQHVVQANAAAKPLAALLLRRRVRRDAQLNRFVDVAEPRGGRTKSGHGDLLIGS